MISYQPLKVALEYILPGSLVDVCVLPMHMHDPPESIIVTLTRKEGSDSTEQFLSFYNDYFKLLFTKNIDLIVGKL